MPGSSTVALRALAAFTTLFACVAGAAAVDAEAVCASLEATRRAAAAVGNADELEKVSRQYAAACREVRSGLEVSLALAEVAACMRAAGDHRASLETSLECIKYRYLSLPCHLEKARSLRLMGMHAEATSVMLTAQRVGERLRVVAAHDATLAKRTGVVAPSRADALREREASATLALAQKADEWIRRAQAEMDSLR